MTTERRQTIFITGSSSGLGRATAKLFSSRGWTVIATMRNPEKEADGARFDGAWDEAGLLAALETPS